MLELTVTSLLAISTPLDEFNYYSKLVEQKDENGDPFFFTMKAGQPPLRGVRVYFTYHPCGVFAGRVCDDCGLLPYEEMIKCDHVPDGAHWKNPHKLKRLKVLFEGDEARGLRELGGIAATEFTACFQKRDIDTLWENPPRTTRSAPDFLYITVDPNGGGASKMGMASGYFDGVDLVVSTHAKRVYFSFFNRGTRRRTFRESFASARRHCSD